MKSNWLAAEDDAGGRWVTINGRAIFIKEGETPEEALKRGGDKPKVGGGKLAPREKYQAALRAAEKEFDDAKGKGNNKGMDRAEKRMRDAEREIKALEPNPLWTPR